MSRSGRVPYGPYGLLTRRFLGFMLDVVIVATVLMLVGAAIASTAPAGEPLPPDTLMAEWIVVVGLWVGYWAVLVGRFGATLGQRAAGVRVVTSDGAPIDVGRQLVRCLVAPFAFAPMALGYIWAILDTGYRSVVDIVSRTAVVRSATHTIAPIAEPAVPADELSDASRVVIDRVSALADALATGGHWRPAGALLRVIGSLTSDRDAWACAAWAFARAGDPAQAFSITKLLVADPRCPSLAWAAHALALASTEAPEAAAEAWRHARALPSDVGAYVEVEIALAADDPAAAQERVEALTRDFPDSLDAWVLAAHVARRRGDTDELQHCAEHALGIAPTSIEALEAQAIALRPPGGMIHRLVSTDEISALVSVLDADPFDTEARARLRSATVGQRRMKLLAATVLAAYGGILSIGFFTGRYGNGNVVLVPLLLVTAVALLVRYCIVRGRLTPRARPWVGYLEALTNAMNQRRGGREPAPLVDAAPTDSVLQSPGRCWCTTLQHTSGVSAVDYVYAHLVEAEQSPAGGVFVFRCPHGLGAYIGMDGELIDPETRYAELYRVEPRDLETVEPDVPIGMYL